jgi:hypothetical protein
MGRGRLEHEFSPNQLQEPIGHVDPKEEVSKVGEGCHSIKKVEWGLGPLRVTGSDSTVDFIERVIVSWD